jgi:hypothetical protein
MDIVFKYLKPWAEMASLFGIPTALAIAVGNMCWQSHLQSEKLRHDLFEKRFEIYRSLRNFIHTLMSKGNVGTADVEALIKHALAAEFLFRPQIVSFINEAHHKALDLEMLEAMRSKRGQDLPESEKKKDQDTIMWFARDATDKLNELFSEDLMLYRQRRFHRAIMPIKAIFKTRRSSRR